MESCRLKIKIECKLTGPLSTPRIFREFEKKISSCTTLDQAAEAVSSINGLAAYKGGSHVAVHPGTNGRITNGSQRVAIITEDTP